VALATAAGFACFLGVWIKLVFAWCLPAVTAALAWRLFWGKEARVEPPSRAASALAAFLAALLVPTAWLLLSLTAEGTPYYEVLRTGRFSLEGEALGTVASNLAAYLVNGSAVVSRSMTWPWSPLDLLPLLLAAAILAAGLAGPRRRVVASWLGGAVLTFAVTAISGRAQAAHHFVFSLFFLVLALASALGPPGGNRGLVRASGALVLFFGASLLWRGPAVLVNPKSNLAKDQLLAWVREGGLDRRTVELHASWGTYYIAHLFGDPGEIVLFSRKFARDPHYLAEARAVAEKEGRGILLITGEPERLELEVVEGVLGPPLATRRFQNWWAFEYRRPGP
jgi:hypothetical protein